MSIFNSSVSFAKYLEDWESFLQKNNTTDWADEDINGDKVDIKTISNNDEFEFVKVVKGGKKHKKAFKTKVTAKTNEIKGHILKWFDTRQFGFIESPKYANVEIFCHASSFIDKPTMGKIMGKEVRFEVNKTPRGLVATNVKTFRKSH